VTLHEATKDKLVFQLGRWEKPLLLKILSLYPCLPPTHQKLTKTATFPDEKGTQKLLDEALADQRGQNKRRLKALLADPSRLKPADSGYRLSVSPAELEWLLQILNDIRVGSWVNLGSPEDLSLVPSKKTAPNFLAMEAAGSFQIQFLKALESKLM
jgi:hypothetical protein